MSKNNDSIDLLGMDVYEVATPSNFADAGTAARGGGGVAAGNPFDHPMVSSHQQEQEAAQFDPLIAKLQQQMQLTHLQPQPMTVQPPPSLSSTTAQRQQLSAQGSAKNATTAPPPPPPPSQPPAEYDGFTNITFDDGQEEDGDGERSGGTGEGGEKGSSAEGASHDNRRRYWDLYESKGGKSDDKNERMMPRDVMFDGGPTGLRFESDYYGNHAIVKGFVPIPGVGKGAAERSGNVRLGDVLCAINGDNVLGWTFEAKQRKLRELRGTHWVGSFLAMEAVGGSRGSISNDGLDEARRFIHEAKLKFFTPPLPEDEMIYCSLERHRGEKVCSFELHRDDTGEFLLAASVDADLTGPFIFHTMKNSHLRAMQDIPSSPDSAVYLGCMVPNFLGTEFRIMDHRVDVRSNVQVERSEQDGVHELGMIFYEVNIMGRVPNFMKVILRKPRQGSGDGYSGKDEEGGGSGGGGGEGSGRISGGGSRGSGQQQYRGAVHPSLLSIKKRVEVSKRLSAGGDTEELSISSPVRSMRTLMRRAFNDLEKGPEDEYGSGSSAMQARQQRSNRNNNNANDTDDGSDAIQAPDGYGFLGLGGQHADDLVMFETKKPTWNEAISAWTLNFNGRVKIPSKKNFLLAPQKGNLAMETEFGEGKVHVRHGKMSKSRFSIDFHYPVPPLTALAVCCSTFSDKRVVT